MAGDPCEADLAWLAKMYRFFKAALIVFAVFAASLLIWAWFD